MPEAEIKNGLFVSPKVTQKLIPNIERGIFDWSAVKFIILHQTWTASAEATFDVWKTRVYGAHFVVDCGGTTYKEAKLIQKKPEKWEYTGKDANYGGIDGKLYQTASLNKKCNHAVSKDSELYPFSNTNSVGIEIVSMFDPIADTYPTITAAQIQSTAWLVNTLFELMPKIVSVDSVYAHGSVSAKHPSEAVTALQSVKPLLKLPERKS